MDSGSVFFLLAIIVVILLVITRPFYAKSEQPVNEEQVFTPLQQPKEDYQLVLRNIRELSGDFEQGKLSQADYTAQRAVLEEKGARLLEEEQQLKKAVKKKQAMSHDIEEMIHSRRQVREEQTSGFCPKCGKPVQKSDQFCPSCGERTHLYL